MSLQSEDLYQLSRADVQRLRIEWEEKCASLTRVESNTRCRIFLGDLNSSYPRYWVTALQGQVGLHILLFYLYRCRIPSLKNDVVSHLCGNTRCCNVNHLAIEPQKINIQRRVCHGTMADKDGEKYKRGKCDGHSDHRMRRLCVL